MSDSHSAFIGLQQSNRWNGTAAQSDIIPEGFRHPPPGSTRELVTLGRPVEDLEASLVCLISDVLYWKVFNVFVRFYVLPLTADRNLTIDDVEYGSYKMITKQYDSRD